jgi:hypothetical protein
MFLRRLWEPCKLVFADFVGLDSWEVVLEPLIACPTPPIHVPVLDALNLEQLIFFEGFESPVFHISHDLFKLDSTDGFFETACPTLSMCATVMLYAFCGSCSKAVLS